MASNNIISIPANESDFEDKCLVLFSCICGDPNFKPIATRGKDQGGLDLIGTRNQNPEIAVGVQCKLVTKGGKLDIEKVTSDIERALQFSPDLSEIYVVTTASDDIKYDQLALSLRHAQKAAGRIVDIQIWGWDTLQIHIRRHVDARNAFDPDYSPSTQILLDATAEIRATVKESHTAIAELGSGHAESIALISEMHTAIVTGDTMERKQVDALLDGQVDRFRDLLNNGKPRTALTFLEGFEPDLPASASPAIRSRVRANIGFAKMKLGDDRGCADALREAFEINPSDEKAQANSLLADIFEGHPETALSRAKNMLAKSPPNQFAASYVYHAASLMSSDVDPDCYVPHKFRDDENTGVNRVSYLRKQRRDTWWNAAHELVERFPESEVARRFAAEAKLEQAYRQQQLPLTNAAGENRRKQISEAAAALQKHWDVVRQYENAEDEIWLSVATNLTTAYRALRLFNEAETVIQQALSINPNDEDALIAAAHIDLTFDRPYDAIAKAEGLKDSPSRTTILASSYSDLGRWSDVIDLITPGRLKSIGLDDRPLVDAILVRALADSASTDVAKSLIEDMLDRWSDDNRVRTAAAELAFRKVPAIATDLLRAAASGLNEESSLADRAMVADCALRHNEFSVVIDALDGFVEPDKVNAPLAWLALAFVNSPIRPRAAKFFSELSPEVLSTPRFARLAGCLDCNRGDLQSAERNLRSAVAGDKADLRSLLMLHSTLMRADNRIAARELIVNTDEQKMEGTPHDQMMLSVLLSHFGEGERALTLGFLIASTNRNHEDVVCRYPGMLFSIKPPPTNLKRGGKIEVGDWFLMKSSDGDQVEGLISAETIPETKTFSPDNATAISLIGASQGQVITIEQPFGGPKSFVVEEVKCKYLWLLDDIMHSHATRFSGSASMGTITMKDHDVQPVLDVVRQSVDYDRAILEFYQQQPVPIEMLAAMHGKSPIVLSELIVHYGGEIDTCFGSDSERKAALRWIRKAAGKGAIVDTLTAWCLIDLEMLEPFKKYFGWLAIAQSTIDDLLELRGREEMHFGHEYMTLGFEGDQAIRQIHSPDDSKERAAIINRSIDTLRQFCEILPVDGFEDVELSSFVHRDTIEQSFHALQIAKNHSLFLLSDDFKMRQMNDTYGSKRAAWIQAVVQYLGMKRRLGRDQVARVNGRLAARKHGYISVDGQALLDVLCMNIPQADAYFDLVAEYIGGAKAEIFSHIAVASDFMSRVWACSIPSWRKGRAAGKLIENLIRNRDTDWPNILAMLDHRLGEIPISVNMRPNLGKSYLQDWIAGHFLWPSIRKHAQNERSDTATKVRK